MTRDEMLVDLRFRLGEAAEAVWSDSELESYINSAITSLYPHWYIYETGTTIAGEGPEQTHPTDASEVVARNIYYVGVRKETSTRVRTIRGWHEGNGVTVVPKVNILDDTLVWSWTMPHLPPYDGETALTIPPQAEEVVVLRAQITALERVITSKAKQQVYFATQAREGTTEQDLVAALDALHASVDTRMKDAPGPPERVG